VPITRLAMFAWQFCILQARVLMLVIDVVA